MRSIAFKIFMGGMILGIGVMMMMNDSWWGLLVQVIGWFILFSTDNQK